MWGGMESLWSSERGEICDSFLYRKVSRSTKTVIVLNQNVIHCGGIRWCEINVLWVLNTKCCYRDIA